MRAVVCSGPGRLALEELPIPEPGPGEVRLRIRACGICGSDIHLLPGRCDLCVRGQNALCRELQIMGIHTNGGFAEYAIASTQRLFPLPSGFPGPLGALAEPMAVVVHGLRRGGVARGSQVLVLGAGTLGLLAILAARDLGAEAWVTARYPHQAERAHALGATRVLTEAEGSADALAALGNEVAFDCVLESVGGEADTLALATAAVAPGGTISVLGLFRGPVSLEPTALFLKEVTLAWSNCYEHAHDGADFARAVALLDTHRGPLEAVTTHSVGLDTIGDGFALASDRRAGAVKVTVEI